MAKFYTCTFWSCVSKNLKKYHVFFKFLWNFYAQPKVIWNDASTDNQVLEYVCILKSVENQGDS